jgi:hypothetical protein
MGSVALSLQRLATVLSEETTQNFLSVLQSFEWPESVPVTYRLYHDEQGRPLIYTMEALPGAYIEVDQATYIRALHHVRVLNGKLMILPQTGCVTKLRPHAEQGVACDPRDICVVVPFDKPNQRWSMSNNDQD